MRFTEPVEVELDHKRVLVFDMWALMQAEREINKARQSETRISVFSVLDELITKPSVDLLLILFWAALLRDDPALTLEAAGHLTSDLRLVGRKVREAIDRIAVADDSEEEEKKTTPLNGSTSGHLPASNSD